MRTLLYKKAAPVGASDHHTGLALDITFSSIEQYKNRFNINYTEEEQRKHDKDFESILKSIGVLKETDKIKDFKI